MGRCLVLTGFSASDLASFSAGFADFRNAGYQVPRMAAGPAAPLLQRLLAAATRHKGGKAAPTLLLPLDSARRNGEPFLARLHKGLQRDFAPVDAAAFVYPAVALVESRFLQAVTAFKLEKFDPGFALAECRGTIDRLDKAFGAGHVLLWKRDTSLGIVADVAQRLAMTDPPLAAERPDALPTRTSVALLYAYGQYLKAGGLAPPLPKETRALIRKLDSLGGPVFRFAPSLLREILSRNGETAVWLEGRLGELLLDAEVDAPDRPGDVSSESDLLALDAASLAALARLAGGSGEPAELVHRLRQSVAVAPAPVAVAPVARVKPDPVPARARRGAGGPAAALQPKAAARPRRQQAGAEAADAAHPAGKRKRLPLPKGFDATGPSRIAAWPLIDTARDVMIYWSPKSACTTVYVWFSAMAGFVDEMRAYGNRPHQHRLMVFYQTPEYRKGLASDLSTFRTLKVLRDPYSRAVSIYRHVLATANADPEMAEMTGGKVGSRTGYSFHQFLDLMERVDFTSCNTHFRPQHHPFEALRPPQHIINISKQDMFTELNRFAEITGIPHVDFAAMDWLHSLEGKRMAKSGKMEGEGLDSVPFDFRAAGGHAPFPSYAQFLTLQARRRIEEIYHIDFEKYGAVL